MIKRNGLAATTISAVLLPLLFMVSGCIEMDQTNNEEVIGPTKEADMPDASKLYVDAISLNEIDKKQQAIDKLNKAIGLAPDFALAYSLRGEIYQKMEKYAESADSYESATKIDPYSFKDFFNLAKVTLITRDFGRAVKAYIEACELRPENLEANLGAARCYYELKERKLL